MAFFSKTLDKLKGALRKTAEVLNTDVRTLFIPGRQIDDAFLIDTEEKLIRADMGVGNVTKIIAEIRDRCVRVSGREQGVQHLHIVLDAVVELREEQPLPGRAERPQEERRSREARDCAQDIDGGGQVTDPF